MIKQVVFLKKRPDMTMEAFMDYYENQHSQLAAVTCGIAVNTTNPTVSTAGEGEPACQ